MIDDDEAVGRPERLHPFFLLTGFGEGIRQMIGGYAVIGYLAASGRLGTAIWAVPAVLLAMAGASFLRWRRFEYRVGTSEIRIDSGIFSRTHRSIPFDRIQDVDIRQGPVARLLGLARVEFETGGSAGAQEEDGALAAVALARAEAIRDLVRARRAPRWEAGRPEGKVEDARPLFAMDHRRLLTAGLFNFSLAVLAGLVGATQTLGDVAGFDVFARRFWRSALDAGTPLADFILAHRIAAGIAGAAVLLLVGVTTGIVRTVLRDYRFRLDRTGTGLRRRRGLVTLSDVNIPLRRAQAAIVASGPVRERFGWRALNLQSLGKDGARAGDHVVAPLATAAEVETILAELDWAGASAVSEWTRVSPAYGIGFTMFAALLAIPLAVLALFEPLAALLGTAVVATAVAARWLSWRRYGFAFQGNRLLVRSGWWSRRIVILPLANIQSIDLVENFLGRRLGVASLAIGVASGSGYSGHGIAALPAGRAREMRRAMLAAFQ